MTLSLGRTKARQQSLLEHYMAWHHQVQASETILQVAHAILATSLVWQTLTSGTSQM